MHLYQSVSQVSLRLGRVYLLMKSNGDETTPTWGCGGPLPEEVVESRFDLLAWVRPSVYGRLCRGSRGARIGRSHLSMLGVQPD
ncbi:MAG: hypothetical protein CL422_12375 [Acidimicrobiaceae bacterium]|nr:hypothetical protein [Acidimicrobiaceae bacterium]